MIKSTAVKGAAGMLVMAATALGCYGGRYAQSPRLNVRDLDPKLSQPISLTAVSPSSRTGASAAADLRETARRAAAPVKARPVSALTFNMEHRDKPKQLAAMADQLRSELPRMPDFILLQEVMFKRAFWKDQDDTAAVLAEELGYHSKGTKRSSDREGIAIASKYPFAYYGSLELEAQTSRLLLGFNRVSVMGEFIVPEIGRVRVVNVHFTNWDFEAHIRRKQLQETLEWVGRRQRQVSADVTILGGDFNCEPDWSEMALVDNAGQSIDMEFHDFNTLKPTHGPEGRPRHRVDYLFISAAERHVRMLGEQRLFIDGVTSANGRRFHLSDHVPVLHEYSVGTSGTAVIAGASGRGADSQ